MNKQTGGMEPLILCREKRGANIASRFYPDRITQLSRISSSEHNTKGKEFPVSKKSPNLMDVALVKTWTERKCLMRLRTNAIDGNVEWVKLLLRLTDYKTYPLMLTRNWWVRDASPDETHKRTKTAVSVMRKLLDSVAIDELPMHIAKDIPTRAVDKNQAILKLWPRVGLGLSGELETGRGAAC